MLSAAVSASPSIQAAMAGNGNSNSSTGNAAVTRSATDAAAAASASAAAAAAANAPLRFEDLTVDDALPPLPRVQRYARSGIALQRLVHVKMLGEVAGDVG